MVSKCFDNTLFSGVEQINIPLGVKKNGLRKLNQEFTKNAFANIKNKANGVEPGFIAQKQWKDEDNEKLFNPNHPHHKKYRSKAENFLYKKWCDPEETLVKEVFASFEVHSQEAVRPHHINFFFDWLHRNMNLEIGQTPKFKEFMEELQAAVKRVYIVKLDYNDPKPGSDKVMITLDRARAPAVLGILGKLVHQHSTAGTRREKNLGAVLEALANDVYKVLCLDSQDLCIRKTSYSDGYVKLLLESKFIEGTEGERFNVLGKQIKHAAIPSNQLISPDDGHAAPINKLGRHKIKALLMGDRDKVGSNGDNIGYIVTKWAPREAILQNIDPGKSLQPKPPIAHTDAPVKPKNGDVIAFIKYFVEKIFFDIKFFLCGLTDAMQHRNIYSDFSFDKHLGSLCDFFRIGYDNFRIFDDTLLSEKMEGVREIIQHWDKVESLFQEYKAAFSAGDLDFSAEIETAWERLQARKLYIEEVFRERLRLTSEELDFLDNVEKLTSKTSQYVGPRNDRVRLKHLRVDPQARHEWHLTKTPGHSMYTLSFTGKDTQEAERVFHKLEQFCSSHGRSLVETDSKRLVHTKMLHKEENKIEVCWTQAEFLVYRRLLSEEAIADYKRQS